MEASPFLSQRVRLGDEIDGAHPVSERHHLRGDDVERRDRGDRGDCEKAEPEPARAGRPRPLAVPEDDAGEQEDDGAERHGVQPVEKRAIHGARGVPARSGQKHGARPEGAEEGEHAAPERGDEEPRPREDRPAASPHSAALSSLPPTRASRGGEALPQRARAREEAARPRVLSLHRSASTRSRTWRRSGRPSRAEDRARSASRR